MKSTLFIGGLIIIVIFVANHYFSPPPPPVHISKRSLARSPPAVEPYYDLVLFDPAKQPVFMRRIKAWQLFGAVQIIPAPAYQLTTTDKDGTVSNLGPPITGEAAVSVYAAGLTSTLVISTDPAGVPDGKLQTPVSTQANGRFDVVLALDPYRNIAADLRGKPIMIDPEVLKKIPADGMVAGSGMVWFVVDAEGKLVFDKQGNPRLCGPSIDQPETPNCRWFEARPTTP
jgi:hypothetical protein